MAEVMSHLVAHRGQKFTFPENAVESMREAIACGATAVEFDVQMSADHVPVVCHDLSLMNTAGVDINISEMNFADLKDISIGEPARLHDKFRQVRLPSLQKMVSVLEVSPHVLVFVELKYASINIFGIDHLLEKVIPQIGPIMGHCMIIADDLQTLIKLKEQVDIPIGWIIHSWTEHKFEMAKRYKVDCVVMNHENYPGHDYDFATDDWDWMMYTTRDPDTAVALFDKGVRFVETDDICYMLKQLPGHK